MHFNMVRRKIKISWLGLKPEMFKVKLLFVSKVKKDLILKMGLSFISEKLMKASGHGIFIMYALLV